MGDCKEVNIPSVNEDAVECDHIQSTNCVVTSEAVPCLQTGKGSTLTNLFKKLCTHLKSIGFLTLKDSPSAYTGAAGSLVGVNTAESGVEYVDKIALPHREYTVATVPAAASNQGVIIMVTDEVGGYVPAFSDGTDWRRVTDRNIIS